MVFDIRKQYQSLEEACPSPRPARVILLGTHMGCVPFSFGGRHRAGTLASRGVHGRLNGGAQTAHPLVHGVLADASRSARGRPSHQPAGRPAGQQLPLTSANEDGWAGWGARRATSLNTCTHPAGDGKCWLRSRVRRQGIRRAKFLVQVTGLT